MIEMQVFRGKVRLFRKFKGRHSYDKIAKMIHDIHCELKLKDKKVVKVTTGNQTW